MKENISKKYKIKLKYSPPIAGGHKVQVAGSFNDWQKVEMRCISGIYEKVLYLPKEKYTYKFIVDGVWIVDENATNFEKDEQGFRNSVIIVGEDQEKLFVVPITVTGKHKTVSIAGKFNNWKPGVDLLEKKSDKFSINLLLPVGTYEYKFFVNNKLWITKEKQQCSDNHGGYNSIIIVNEK